MRFSCVFDEQFGKSQDLSCYIVAFLILFMLRNSFPFQILVVCKSSSQIQCFANRSLTLMIGHKICLHAWKSMCDLGHIAVYGVF